MAKLHVRNGALVLVCDGRKALILRNEGDAELLNLRRAAVEEQVNPATHDQGSDSPGRTMAPSGTRQGSLGETDWHTIEEQRFAAGVAERLKAAAHAGEVRDLIVIAPPKTLAELRHDFSKELQARIVAELPKDLTNHTIPDIERLLSSQEV